MTNSIATLWKLTAKQLIDLLDKKDISPDEVLDSSINRIHEVNPSINAVVALCIDRAKNNIDKKESSSSLLKNIPFLVKDVTDVGGIKTTYGSKYYENNTPNKSDILVFVETRKEEIEKRIKKRVNFNRRLFNKFKKIQYSKSYKKRKSDFIIKNDFTKKSVKRGIRNILDKIQ